MYFVYVHNNKPAYEGDDLSEALKTFYAEVNRTLDGVGPRETIEMFEDETRIHFFIPDEDNF